MHRVPTFTYLHILHVTASFGSIRHGDVRSLRGFKKPCRKVETQLGSAVTTDGSETITSPHRKRHPTEIHQIKEPLINDLLFPGLTKTVLYRREHLAGCLHGFAIW